MSLLYDSLWRTGSKKQKGMCESSNGAGILDIDLRRMRSRMFHTFSIKDVGINKKVKQLLRSPRHSWYDQSKKGPKNLTNNKDK